MHSHFIQPLLAADFTHLAITLVLIFFAVMKQLFDASKQANKKRQAPADALGKAAEQPAGQPRPIPVQPAGQQADPLRNQVEEFLRRAGERPQAEAGSPPKPQPRPASEIELLLQESRQRLERREPRPTAAAPPSAPPVAQPPQRSQRRVKKRQSVAEHVAEQVASRSKSISKMTSQLGQRIVAEDQEFDIKLKAKFDHALGSLAGSVNPVAEEKVARIETPAEQIAAMLANPTGVRQAMILNEILNRPSDRW